MKTVNKPPHLKPILSVILVTYSTLPSRYKMKNDRSQLKKRMVYIYIDIDTSGPESGTVGSNINIE